ncbi:MAG: hypothetical protein KBF69_08200 [Saprospiraceae bacterium]|jgi:hypothetical protein|nr:hypothetical protein [Saprospiraceae bacterium]
MEKITNQTLVKRNLLVASLFVTSFEMLKTSVQDRIKGCLCFNSSFNSEGELEFEISDEYKKQVLDRIIPNIDRRKYRDYHLFYSSCLWLQDNNVIDQSDINELEQIRKHRNLISHNPLKLLVDDNININISLLKKSQELLTKIEKWWIIEFEISGNLDFDGQEIDESQVSSGTSIFLDYIMEIAFEEINKTNT